MFFGFHKCKNINITGKWERYRIQTNFLKSNDPIWNKDFALKNGLIYYGPQNKKQFD